MAYKNVLCALMLAAVAVLTGCAGEDSAVSSTSDGYEISSGLAQKGPLLRGSAVTINELTVASMQPNGKSYAFEITDDSGRFNPSGITFGSTYLESTALGYYFDELSGQKSSDMVFLRGLSNLATDKAVNVNVLTSVIKDRVKRLMTTTPKQTFAAARPQAEKELLRAFYIYNAVDLLPGTTVGGVSQPANFMELDLGKKRSADQILAAISGLVVQIGRTGTDVSYFLSQLETDLTDDGLLNNSPGFPVPVALQLSNAAKNANFSAVSANLNAFYSTKYAAGDLSQWIDSSGGLDRVIDKFKFSASGIPLGTESRSPEYVAGSEDAGQCFSVSAGKLYRNGLPVAGTVKAVKADRFSIGLAGSAPAATLHEFVQRSAPDARGVCPALPPAVGFVRVAKYQITLLNGIAKIAAASTGHSLAVMADGTLLAWGNNSHGQLGDGTVINRSRPVVVGTGYATVAAGVRFTIGIKKDGSLWSWGDNEFGILGDGTSGGQSVTPKLVGTGFSSATARGSFVAAVKTDGSLWTWGTNNFSQIGNASNLTQLVPLQVGTGYAYLAAGSNFVVALKQADAGVWGWGVNSLGQMALGYLSYSVTSPTLIIPEAQRQVAAGWDYAMAVNANGDLKAWGDNSYCQLGDGSTGVVTTPKLIGTGFVKAAPGGWHSAAIKVDGSLWAWGTNMWGQAGDGSGVSVCTPKQIGVGFVDLAAGNHHTVALKRDGTLWAWGDNQFGQIGDGSTVNRVVPVQVLFQ